MTPDQMLTLVIRVLCAVVLLCGACCGLLLLWWMVGEPFTDTDDDLDDELIQMLRKIEQENDGQ